MVIAFGMAHLSTKEQGRKLHTFRHFPFCPFLFLSKASPAMSLSARTFGPWLGIIHYFSSYFKIKYISIKNIFKSKEKNGVYR